jgi:hypothetical protein
MRRVLVILVCALAVVPTAFAAARATGDGVLELRAVSGTVGIGKEGQLARGVLWGQMDKGRLVVVDPIGDGGQAYVSGWDTRSVLNRALDGTPTVTAYTGTDIHFRITGGKYRLSFSGSGIDLTAIGVGVAYLAGDYLAADGGDYAVDSKKWIPVPVYVAPPQKSLAVPFGIQPTQTP